MECPHRLPIQQSRSCLELTARRSAKLHIWEASKTRLRKGEEGFMVWVTEEKADACHVDLRNDPEIDLEMDGEQREEMLALL